MDGETSQNFGSFQPQPKNQPQFQNQKKSLAPIGDLFTKTWQAYTSRLDALVGIMAIWLGFAFLTTAIMMFVGMGAGFGFGFGLMSFHHARSLARIQNLSVMLLIILIFVLLGAIIYPWLQVSVLYVIKERKQKLSIGKALRKGWSRWISYLWISFLVGLCVAGGTILLIVPGIIFFVWFAFAQYLLVDKDVKGIDALSKSRELVRGYWWPVFGRILLITLVIVGVDMVLGLIPFIGNLVIQLLVYPFMFVFYFILYEDLKQLKESQLLNSEVAQ